ncbi:MAG: zf-HC2 domain-containing protein [Candidatus Eisenbacteria bacterium]|uniref:Zf-HC2 domain-containing protein n=1 Tax=Eiseniibacteriota bacterium TaxID=2212470 RepID=A0A956NEF4_UNCEI|nr:zf-HC2 domain-containing protein [Candidatus Eisenbacteria bacterium]MCB9465407.1 zf-HC2 domain-containing protein [Candidatus Eisenbacteria bacterium]
MSPPHVSDDRLLEYVLGDLSEGDRAEVDVHVRNCSSCRVRLLPALQLVETYRGAPGPEAPMGVLVELLNRQSEARRSARPSRRPLADSQMLRTPSVGSAAATLAAAALVFASGLWIGRQSVPSGGAARTSPDVRMSLETTSHLSMPLPPQIPFEAAPPLEPVLHVGSGHAEEAGRSDVSM